MKGKRLHEKNFEKKGGGYARGHSGPLALCHGLRGK